MNVEQLYTEVKSLNGVTSPALDGLAVSSHISNDHTIALPSYRQTTLELSDHIKLSRVFEANTPIEHHSYWTDLLSYINNTAIKKYPTIRLLIIQRKLA